jgi:hypothetical protein
MRTTAVPRVVLPEDDRLWPQPTNRFGFPVSQIGLSERRWELAPPKIRSASERRRLSRLSRP